MTVGSSLPPLGSLASPTGIELPPAELPSALDPRSQAAADIELLWWVMLVLGVAVFVFVVGMLWWASRRRAPEKGPRWLAGTDERFVAFWGIGVTGVILVAVLAITVQTGAATYWPEEDPTVEIEVVGHKFWWEITYDGGETVTANELVVPTGEPVRLLLESEDVIHSFWVPQLHGKMDMIPGHTNEFWIEASEPGTYRGICAEYCGLQHAQMHFLVHAEPRDEFDAWLAAERDPAEPPSDESVESGMEVFADANCVACHAVEGHFDAEPDAGPDLTHFGSRETIAAAMQPNERDELAAWLIDPHDTKPGVRMPPAEFDDDELDDLLDYLESLQ